MARASRQDEANHVAALARRLGLPAEPPRLLKAAHHTSFLLAEAGLVVRVLSGEAIEWAMTRARRELAVVRALHRRGAPVAAAADPRLAGPHRMSAMMATLWPYRPHERVADETDFGIAAETLAAVHHALAAEVPPLPPFTDTLDRCGRLLADPAALPLLPLADRRLLQDMAGRLRRAVEGAGGRWVALHGDAHPGNLLLGGAGPAWIDWEEACRGPIEWDVASLPPAAWPLFPTADLERVAACGDLRSLCVAVWCWVEPERSDALAEAAEYHLGRVRELAGERGVRG
jgi:aminoglycoside phosphotransferase (APT) family kinase protein